MIKKFFDLFGATNLVRETLSYKGRYSEKRATKLFVVMCMMGLTMYDTIANSELRWDLFLAWLTFIGYDGYRMTAEKKMEVSSGDKPESKQNPDSAIKEKKDTQSEI
jgi:hypothetical protein